MPLRNFISKQAGAYRIKLISYLSFLLLVNISFSQSSFERKLDTIPISDGSGLLKNTFSGGHNNIEHQFVDLDGDNDLDIFFLDSDGTFGLFENIGNNITPEYKFSLDKINGMSFSDWFYLVDIDEDGDFDYFTGNNDRMSFYKNNGTTLSPSFILEEDTVLNSDGESIFSEFGSNPIFVDVDADNDYDFITGNSAGTLTFFENIGTPQNFNLKFITTQWQDILIIGGADNPLHGASSIDFIDIDDDNDLDLFWGDFFGKSIYVIENQGTPSIPDMQLISNIYPVNEDSVKTSGFNMPRFADIDNDGDYDFFVSVLYDPTVPQSLMFLRNEGNSSSANHNLVTIDYLKTLDVGNNSVPVFVDIDDDSDLDLFIGSLNNPLGSIHFLENTGSNSDPEFSYLDSSFFNIESDLSVYPAFGDLDNDSDNDLIIGRFNGTLSYYENTGSPSSPNFSTGINLLNGNGEPLDVGSSAAPFLIDVDGDQDLDLVIGGFNGRFYFYENTGNLASYQFTLNADYFLNLDVGDNATPFMIDIDSSGTLDLLTGNRDGKFFYYKNTGTHQSPVWELVTDFFINENFGGNTVPCFVDIDNDDDNDLLVGNVKGGIYFYNNSGLTNVAGWEIKPFDKYSLDAFPNPFNPGTQIRIETNEGQKTAIEIFNVLGEKVKTLYDNYLPAGTKTFYWNGENDSGTILPSGIYLILAYSDQNKKAIKVSFLK